MDIKTANSETESLNRSMLYLINYTKALSEELDVLTHVVSDITKNTEELNRQLSEEAIHRDICADNAYLNENFRKKLI